MRLILQRVSKASVTIDRSEKREIGPGLMVLLGVTGADNEAISTYMAQKMAQLRIFTDENGNMNRSLLDVGGECLIVSNFTLYANSRKGRRPSFAEAAPPDHADPLYRHFVGEVRTAGVETVVTGEFGAKMAVEIHNDGPVTIILDSDEIMPKKQLG